MSKKYREFSGLNLPSIEKEILTKWKREEAFEKSVSLREGKTPFVFYEGPPSANGMPGIHHVISRTIKDLVCRYKTMKGFQVKRKGGWDTHGLPVELGVEKELGITKEDIGKKISVEDYNKKCREAVLRYKKEWDDITVKMGYWVDLNNPYITFENNYIETLWWLLKKLYYKGFLYESVSIQPYSPAAGTGLSSHELNQPGTYKDVKDTSVTVLFKAVKNEKSKFLFDVLEKSEIGNQKSEIFFIAWTTTPWTLPSNLGLTVGAKIDYVLVKTFNPYTHQPVNIVLAKALLHKYFKPEGENGDFENYSSPLAVRRGAGGEAIPYKILSEFKGIDLEDCSYEQLMPYEANARDKINILGFVRGPKPFRIVTGNFVTTEDGTGIVHTAPAFGADDFKVGKEKNLGIINLVDRQGRFIEGVGEYSHRYVKDYTDDPNYQDVNVDICVMLKKEGKAFKVEKFEHSYPHCWRTDKPILYYPLDAWFIKTTALRERMVELNKTINWKPKSTGDGRFGNWLENMVDWNLSRSRFWGTPLPVWRTEDGMEKICIGSIEELTKEYQKAVDAGFNKNSRFKISNDRLEIDLHRPYVDNIELVSASGKLMKRVPDLVDVWFDSGSMPYAQLHFPFENKEVFAKNYPADFICEGVDQTRGWFYTLHAIASLVKEDVEAELKAAGLSAESIDGRAFKAVVSNGLVLDKNGNKMSKRLGNAVNPFDTIEKFGADATRWYLITNASPWDNLKFDLDGIKEVQRKFFGTLYNTYQFFALYANVDGFSFEEKYIPLNERPEIDRWILSSLNTLIKKVNEAFDDYEPTIAGRLIEEFVDEHLSNWYVRLCRRRFWKGEYGTDKISAYQTLYECLETLTKLMAPISPFFSDAIFNNLNEVTYHSIVSSVHHTDFPKANEAAIDSGLEGDMQLAQDITSLTLSIRKKEKLKVRQPLQKILVLKSGDYDSTSVLQNVDIFSNTSNYLNEIIQNETNVKQVQVSDTKTFQINFKPVPDFQKLSQQFGKLTSEVGKTIKNWDKKTIAHFNEYGWEDFHMKDGKLQISGSIGTDAQTIRIQKGIEVNLVAEDIPGWSVASKGSLTVALDITITDELKKEGEAREFVNRIQNIRKDIGLDLTDRINLAVEKNEELYSAINDNKIYICGEILADNIGWLSKISNGTEIEVNGVVLKVTVSKKE